MKETFVFDASALIAFLNNEEGADMVEGILRQAKDNGCVVYINKLNLLEIYYGIYREDGDKKAEDVLMKVLNLPLVVIDVLDDNLFKEAGKLKATYKISLADSIALASAKTKNAWILTTDHHEFDPLDKQGVLEFYWIR